MKSSILRRIAAGAALLVLPMAGLAALGVGPAGATTTAVTLKSVFTFTSAGGSVNHLTCPTTGTFAGTKNTTGTMIQIKVSPTVWPKCLSTGATRGGQGIPATATIHVLFPNGAWILLPTLDIKATSMVIKIVFPLGDTITTSCDISFPTPISGSLHATTKQFKTTTVSTHNATVTHVSGPGTACTALTHLLHTTPTSKFSGTVTLNKKF
jgi:hypothetical protein